MIQLTMANNTKSFNEMLVRKILTEENHYLTDLFAKMPLPMTALNEFEGVVEEEQQDVKNGKSFPHPPGKGTARAQSFEELHQKLEELKGKKLSFNQKLMKKNLKTRLKKQTKKEERQMQMKLARTELAAAGGLKVKKEDGEAPKVARPKPVFNSEGKMVFSKFDFSDVRTRKKHGKDDKDPKKILVNLEKQKEKLERLEAAGEKEKVEELKEKQAWKVALAKAGGEKVKDDPELLKKSVKKLEQRKRHSAKTWESRIEKVQKSQMEQQNKRQENILKRKKDKKTNKLKRASKKGRIIPGF